MNRSVRSSISKHAVKVSLGPRSYDVVIRAGALKSIDRFFRAVPGLPRRGVIVSNRKVFALYGGVLERLNRNGFDFSKILVPEGEGTKSLEQASRLYHCMLKRKMNRESLLVALGGGIVGDLAGFAAATYLRGIPFVQIPTSLLAQVDSSVGGKVAVNLPEGKNLVGSFYQPRLVVIDPLCLKTLAEKEWRNGMAEVIKYGLIRDRPFFDFLDRRRGEILAKKPRALEIMIRESVRNKAEVVARDEREKGMRAILNFGHTFGHAIEKTWDFKKYSHGRAVALGMGMACRYSFSRGILDAPERDAALRLLEAYRLNTALRTDRWETIHRNLYYDKKITDRGLTFILIRRIGSVFAEHGVPGGEIRSFLRDCCAPGLTKPRHGRGRTL